MQGNEFDAFHAEMLANKIGLWIAQRSQGEKFLQRRSKQEWGRSKLLSWEWVSFIF